MARVGKDEMLQTLSKVGLFAGCTKRELQAVSRLCTPLRLEAGYVLTTEGGPAQEAL